MSYFGVRQFITILHLTNIVHLKHTPDKYIYITEIITIIVKIYMRKLRPKQCEK